MDNVQVCRFVCLSAYLPPVHLSVCSSAYLCVYLPVCLTVSLLYASPSYKSKYQPLYCFMYACIDVFLSDFFCLSTCLHTHLPIYSYYHLPTYLLNYLHTYLPFLLHAYLPTYLLVYFSDTHSLLISQCHLTVPTSHLYSLSPHNLHFCIYRRQSTKCSYIGTSGPLK